MDAYIALDLETTGLSPKSDRILEIGAARVLNGADRDHTGDGERDAGDKRSSA